MARLQFLGGPAEDFPYTIISAPRTKTEVIPVRPEYGFTDRLCLALFHRPRWTQSLTMIETDPHTMTVNYSDDPAGEKYLIACSEDGQAAWKENR